jgi:daunorubicin resistance ABC transporter ATP-binding subunit
MAIVASQASAVPPRSEASQSPAAPAIVEVDDLVKVYPATRGGEPVRAVDGVSFRVGAGEFFGFLGPNGAGKTTTIRILATLTRPTSGRALVAGIDALADPGAVRSRIGLAMQTVALENMLTGRENLELIGRLHRVPGAELQRRVDELLELMNLTAAAKRLAGTYSGGMRRRLDLATALVHRPTVLFLDEPTEGLDPQSRSALWEELMRINRAGTTMFLTTHYMEEADRLCDRLAIVDGGRIAVEGTPTELKRSIGADAVEIALAHGDEAESLATAQANAVARLRAIDGVIGVEPSLIGVSVAVANAQAAVPTLLRSLDADGIRVAGLTMREPSLDDVFMRYTGRHIRAEEADRPLDLGWWG